MFSLACASCYLDFFSFLEGLGTVELVPKVSSYPHNEVGRVEKRVLKRVFRGGRDSTA